jgi:UDP-glucuronate 4-epimerase
MVTGAAGFIGSHLCESLLADGWRVRGLDDLDDFYSPQVKRGNLSACLANTCFSLFEGDIRDRRAVEEASEGADILVHLAARAGVRPSIDDPLLYQDVNVNGTCVVLEAARRHGIARVVFASSSSVYGNNRKVPFAESDPVDFPISPYAASKRAGELLCHAYHHLFGLSITCLRFFTVYGPRQRPDLAIHKFTRLIEEGRPIPVFGDGSMMRDHTYIDDILLGVRRAMERCAGYRIYNLGESRPVSLSDLIAAIEQALGKQAVIERLPPQAGDVDRTYADVTLAMKELDYRPATHLADGLARFVEWFRRPRG